MLNLGHQPGQPQNRGLPFQALDHGSGVAWAWVTETTCQMSDVRRTGELAEMKKQLEKHALDVEVLCRLCLCYCAAEKGDESGRDAQDTVF